MKLTNDSYMISIGTKNFTEMYFRDEKGWVKYHLANFVYLHTISIPEVLNQFKIVGTTNETN